MFLSNHSYFSLRYGTLSPEQLVQWAAQQGLKSLVLTDINNTSAVWEFVSLCNREKIKPIVGVDFRQKGKFLYTAIAKNNAGFREICALLTQHEFEKLPFSRVAPPFQNCHVIYRHLPKPPTELLANEYVGIRPQEATRLFRSDLLAYRSKLVVFNPITFIDSRGYMTHKLLRAIDQNTMITQLDESILASDFDYPSSIESIEDSFAQYPEILENTTYIIDDCEILLQKKEVNKMSFQETKTKDVELLRSLAIQGCERRYGTRNEQARERLLTELDVITKMGFSAYFLITWDIIKYAQERSFSHVGRGSGANSIVAYCLDITDVDPIELDLYFERFLNQERVSPPDFDIDFSWNERDEIIKYIFEKYGKDHVALICTYNTFKGKSIIRELGKVFGLKKEDVDMIIKYPNDRSRQHHMAEKIFQFGKLIEDFPNYLSIHAGGLLISERPLSHHTSIHMMPKGFPITNFDMHTAEKLSFHKYDILSQRGLGHIRDAVQMVARNKGIAVDIHDMTKIKNDEATVELLRSGSCVGCFYIESPAMRGLLYKLKCDNYIDLIAASSIIRPGVAKSGMMKQFISRSRGEEKVSYLHPVFKDLLSETYGVMIYQEDVMKVVHHFAGFDLSEADLLRRVMTGKAKSNDILDRLKGKFFSNCRDRGHDENLIYEVWRQIESFSGYAFCKAHSASFAVESFQSLYLKAHYPIEFMVSVINNHGGYYSTEFYIQEARMLGAKIEAPCINSSDFLTKADDNSIYLGLELVKGIHHRVISAIIEDRQQNGHYKSLSDLINRVDVPASQLSCLIRIGAFRFTSKNKYELMWERIYKQEVSQVKKSALLLFPGQDHSEFQVPVFEEKFHEKACDELELLGFPLCSPFSLISTDEKQVLMASKMSSQVGKKVVMLGYLIMHKDITTSSGKHMNFIAWIDENGRLFDSVHFPRSLQKYPLEGKGCYLLHGVISEEFGFPSLQVNKMERQVWIFDDEEALRDSVEYAPSMLHSRTQPA